MGQQPLEVGALLRWTRACLLSVTILTVSALAHASGGGLVPSVGVLLGLTAVTTLVLAGLLGRPASGPCVVVLLAGGQAALHLVMTALSGHAAAPSAGRGHHHATHAHAVAHSAQGEAPSNLVGTWLSHLPDDLAGPNLAMACAHLLAAAALGWWLATGEQALWRLILLWATSPGLLLLAGRLAVAMRALTASLDTGDLARVVSCAPEHLEPEDRLLLACAVARRGPPSRLSV